MLDELQVRASLRRDPIARPEGLTHPEGPLGELANRLDDALELFTEMVDGRIVIALPDGETELFVGAAPRPNGPIRLYVGAALPPGVYDV